MKKFFEHTNNFIKNLQNTTTETDSYNQIQNSEDSFIDDVFLADYHGMCGGNNNVDANCKLD